MVVNKAVAAPTLQQFASLCIALIVNGVGKNPKVKTALKEPKPIVKLDLLPDEPIPAVLKYILVINKVLLFVMIFTEEDGAGRPRCAGIRELAEYQPNTD